MDNEYRFEQWRTAVLKKTPCAPSLKNWVWRESFNAVCALINQRASAMLAKMNAEQKAYFREELCIMFMEFIRDNPEKAIGWCFKAFKMRFPDVLTRFEANQLGLGVKPNKGIKNYETRTLCKVLTSGRHGNAVHPVVNALQVPSIPFDERDIESNEDGTYTRLMRFV